MSGGSAHLDSRFVGGLAPTLPTGVSALMPRMLFFVYVLDDFKQKNILLKII